MQTPYSPMLATNRQREISETRLALQAALMEWALKREWAHCLRVSGELMALEGAAGELRLREEVKP